MIEQEIKIIILIVVILLVVFVIIMGSVLAIREYTHCPVCDRWARTERGADGKAIYIVCSTCDSTYVDNGG